MDKNPSIAFLALGTIIHYSIGVLFAFLYFVLNKNGMIDSSILEAIVFGVALGIVAIVGWKLFFMINKHPLPYSLPIYFAVIFTGHIVLALGIFWTHQIFNEPASASLGIPLC
jgi:hypothetical protein